MQASVTEPVTRSLYQRLMDDSLRTDNDHLLASMLSSWRDGNSALPQWLGLDRREFAAMLEQHFSAQLSAFELSHAEPLDQQRLDELQELETLLLQNRAEQSRSEIWIARIISAGCQASDHLWQDLGLWSRQDLSHMMMHNFPSLAKKNDKNMKWKKFLYKQLCITEGIYTCRAPSCEVCADYSSCFGPED